MTSDPRMAELEAKQRCQEERLRQQEYQMQHIRDILCDFKKTLAQLCPDRDTSI